MKVYRDHYIGGVVQIIFGLLFPGILFFQILTDETPLSLGLIIPTVILLLFGGIFLYSGLEVFYYKLEETEDGFKETNLRNSFETSYGDIKGFRKGENGIIIFTRDGKKTSISSEATGFAKEIREKVTSESTDLDKEELERSKEEVQAKNGKILTRILKAFTFTLNTTAIILSMGWMFFSGYIPVFLKDYVFITLLLFPILSLLIATLSFQRIRITDGHPSGYPSLSMATGAPAFALAMKLLINVFFEDYGAFFTPVAITFLPLALLYLFNYRRYRINSYYKTAVGDIGLYVFLMMYAFALVGHLNMQLSNPADHEVFSVPVLEVEPYDYEHSSGEVIVKEWRKGEEKSIRVPNRLHETVKAGDNITIIVYSGFFDIPFYDAVKQ
ncbi:MAG: hypothetical protein AAF740_08685 [Bacteroidota bacterium]